MDAGERHSHHAEKLRRLLAHEIARHEDSHHADRLAGDMVDAILATVGALLTERMTIHEVSGHGTVDGIS